VRKDELVERERELGGNRKRRRERGVGGGGYLEFMSFRHPAY
jgi:hypothetical protein